MNFSRRAFLGGVAAAVIMPALPKPAIADSISAGNILAGTIDASKLVVTGNLTVCEFLPLKALIGDMFFLTKANSGLYRCVENVDHADPMRCRTVFELVEQKIIEATPDGGIQINKPIEVHGSLNINSASLSIRAPNVIA